VNAQTYFAPAKLNLFLHVVGRRADGYHLLESVFQLLDVGDDVEIAVRPDGLVRRSRPIDGVPEDGDLTIRAARALKEATGCALGAEIGVTKRLPQGGGLGGGSSDAATVLLALNRLWGLDLPRAELAGIGLRLGADVPFFVFGRNAFARGVGEELLAVDLPVRWYAVVTPPCQVPTAAIFRAPELTRNSVSVKIADFSAGAWEFPIPQFRNDLEPVARGQFAAVAQVLEWLRGFDAQASLSARMTGSGASVFAGFGSAEAARQVVDARPAGCGGFVARGLDAHPLCGYARD
jgi:4-diphosphocytidyl-2-C-methyl-D-erythritol kinase